MTLGIIASTQIRINGLLKRAWRTVERVVLFFWIGTMLLLPEMAFYEQALELGLKVRVVESDGNELIAIRRTDLSTEDEKRKLLALADNHTSDTSMFDFATVVEDLALMNLAIGSLSSI